MKRFYRLMRLFLVLFFSGAAFLFAYTVKAQTASVLTEGTWLKIGVTQKGIYKIDRSFLQSAGLNPSSIDPRKLALFGNGGGGMLPQPNSEPRPYDLIENAIHVEGEADGSFDASDYVLFFGNSPDKYAHDAECNCYRYEKNLYSDTTFYFLRIDGPSGRRIASRPSAASGAPATVTTFDYLYAHERDVIKIGDPGSGRYWHGETFSVTGGLTQVFDAGDGSFVPGTNLMLVSSVAAHSFGESSFDVFVNGSQVLSQVLPPRGKGNYDPFGTAAADTIFFPSTLAGSGLQLTYTFHRATGNTSIGYLDYFFIQGLKPLEYAGQALYFRNKETLQMGQVSYVISNGASVSFLWDITDPVEPVNQGFLVTGSELSFTANQEGVHEYVAFDQGSFQTPVSVRPIPNQNLKDGIVPDLVIITHPDFAGEARRLAAFRRAHDGLDVKVVLIEQIYNEFSSGMQDVSALRDYMRYLYRLNPEKLKYLLLFGDCSYDYKRRIVDQNFVPVYQSRESLDQITSFSSDDYFGFLDDDEGYWEESEAGDHLLDIGIGRLPVVTPKHAADIVNKLIAYSTDAQGLGEWKNDLYFLADDGDVNIHLRDADRLASYVDTAYAHFNVHKLYLDAFPQELIDNKQRSPRASEAIRQAINKGAFLFNYSGHGNEIVLTDERVVHRDSLAKLTNGTRLPLFVTATCEFGRYDNPGLECGAENLIRNPNGGAIALLTTTRPVYSYTNFILNQAFYYEIFKIRDGQYPRLGDVMKHTKNNSLRGPLNRNFALLGDPSLRLNYPAYDLKITHLNGSAMDNVPDTVSAMNRVSVEGLVVDRAGNPVPGFNGELTVTMFDKPVSFTTLGDENQPATYSSWANALYRGRVSVKDGAFRYEFVVPKNTSYQQARGKIVMYARPAAGLHDANGATIDFFLGGSKPPELADDTPPEISAFINDESFRPGQEVNATPLLLVRLKDESGINISGKGIGQNLSFTLDDDEPVILNDYYLADLDDFTAGRVLYPLPTLSTGKHQLTVKAWDTFSNGATTTIHFVVSNDTKVRITNVVSYPNPAAESAIFRFEHDRGDHLLTVKIELIDQKGAIVDTIEWRTSNTAGMIESPPWNRNYNGRRIENGIYIYRLLVTDEQDGNQNFAFGKLILTN